MPFHFFIIFFFFVGTFVGHFISILPYLAWLSLYGHVTFSIASIISRDMKRGKNRAWNFCDRDNIDELLHTGY